ncbi:MAG TPA: phosphate ABC transporter permease subunit PstC [Solirubrobacterales bacterium]|nr:phosphate ABC transporter permease subunit PstC [Solirubrobacterales bacterium]
MSASAPAAAQGSGHGARVSLLRKRADQIGDRGMYGICLIAALLSAGMILLVGYQIVHGALPAIEKFGLGFVTSTTWQPNFGKFGAGVLLFGTAVTSGFALLLGGPIAIAIGLFLTLLAPKSVAAVIGPLVELLAAIPSVILGFWGLVVLGPFVQEHVEPFLHDSFGFIPIFGEPQTTGLSVFTASLILTIMVIPIIASISRDLFRSVPPELQDGAAALGATRWEVVRGVVLPVTSNGVIAACILGLGRALGEAIAVSQVVGAGSRIDWNLFAPGSTLAAQIALQFPGALTELHKASLFYCGLILLVIGLIANLAASWIGRRFSYNGAVNW